MRLAFTTIFLLFVFMHGWGQHRLQIQVGLMESGEPLPGATVSIEGTPVGATADENGMAELRNVPGGLQILKVSSIGYREQNKPITISGDSTQLIRIFLEPEDEMLEEIVISSTRSSRTIADIPTRVEFIAGEELDEKANMKPGDIRMLLSESTGIQTQQTSPTSANSSIRIQGLDGRYTQILKDGFPLYAGFSGGLGLLQTPPLDLKQVEVVKGSTSTLYGGGAIAGLVNLISRTPSKDLDLRFFSNITSAKGVDLSGFYGQQYGKVGVTVFASRNSSEPYDPADIDLSAIPKFERYSVHPKLFVDFNSKTAMSVGFNYTTEDRIGGDIHYIKGNGDAVHRYFEENDSHRYSTQLSFSHKLNDTQSILVKNSVNHFDRIIAVPDYRFDGTQNSTFTEVSFVSDKKKVEWVAGLNLWTDDFSEKKLSTVPLRDYTQTTFGAFIQNHTALNETLTIETGLRGDYVIDFGFALLPRVSILYKPNTVFTSRIGGGFGYKSPTIFTEESERIQYQRVLPVSTENNKLEKSYGANWDLNYRAELGELGLNINHLFFYTYLRNPLILSPVAGGDFLFTNSKGFMDSKGTETNLKFELHAFKLFVGYTFTDTKIHASGATVQNPLTARHRLNNVLMYEVEEKWKIGLEAYYFGKQRLTDNSSGKAYWICGFMVEKLWEKISIFINFENFLDARQTRFDTIYTGTVSNPVFRDIYAPVDGFVINGGVKVKW